MKYVLFAALFMLLQHSMAGALSGCRIKVLPSFKTNGLQVIFEAKLDIADQNATYLWSFGDNTYAQTAKSVHNYPCEGNYTCTLRVKALNGCERVTIMEIYVFEKKSRLL